MFRQLKLLCLKRATQVRTKDTSISCSQYQYGILSTDQKMINAGNAIDAHGKISRWMRARTHARAHTSPFLHATRNAWSF